MDEAVCHTQGLLDSLFLPGVPPEIQQRYKSLEKRAQNTDFDILEEDIVVIDTETTGLSFRDSELIQIAAARISGRQIQETFETFVHPKQLIPEEITALTHITNADVAQAPSATEAVQALVAFVREDPVLAHNATFDRTFIKKAAPSVRVSESWIDTLALSRIALPCLKTHRLADMAQAFGCAGVTHRAADDVAALAGMWRIILLGLSDLPDGLLELFSEMHSEVAWAYRPLFSYLTQRKEQTCHSFDLKTQRARLLSSCLYPAKKDANKTNEPLQTISQDEIKRYFENQSPFADDNNNFEKRPEQSIMALEVTQALNNSTHRAIEAGTGVGKSLAYLLPAIYFAQKNNITIGVATKTNALADQLISSELPRLKKILSKKYPTAEFRFSNLKGYENYPCLFRLEKALFDEKLPLEAVFQKGKSKNTIASEMLTTLATVASFVSQNPEGDLDTLGIRWRYVPKSLVCTTYSECLHATCPFYPHECLLFGARKRAAASDIVVTNHSLLLRDIQSEGRILPVCRHWIIDEAHGFEAEARRQWAREVSAQNLRACFEALGDLKAGLLHRLYVSVSHFDNATLMQRLLTKLKACLARAQICSANFFSELDLFSAQTKKAESAYDRKNIWLDQSIRTSKAWQVVAEAGSAFWDALVELCKEIESLVAAAPTDERGKLDEFYQTSRTLFETRDNLCLILAGQDLCYVYSLDMPIKTRDKGTEILKAEQIDIGKSLAELWYPEMQSVIFTSATIAIGKNFDHFNSSIGLSELESHAYKDVQLSSSFDFDSNMSCVVIKDMPLANDKSYIHALEEVLFDIHQKMEGSVLTLFTNRNEMESVFLSLEPKLARLGLELVQQERKSSARALRESFIANKSQSLFALRSFWEGFDAQGDTLRCVVIVKLPFTSPYDPLAQERQQQDERAWWRYSLPEAVLSVKQAAGRLLRSNKDKGILVLTDSRVAQKSYGKQFINSLPSHNCQLLNKDLVGRFIKMWRQSH